MPRANRSPFVPLVGALAACSAPPMPSTTVEPPGRPSSCIEDDGKGERALRLVLDACKALEAGDEARVAGFVQFPVPAHVMTYERIGPNVYPMREMDRSFASARALIEAHPCPALMMPLPAKASDPWSRYEPPITKVERGYRVRPSSADALLFRVESDDWGCMTIRSFRSE